MTLKTSFHVSKMDPLLYSKQNSRHISQMQPHSSTHYACAWGCIYLHARSNRLPYKMAEMYVCMAATGTVHK